jgi:L-ascorbate metabolism protein UlaG (beta-lactamase superfamily)
VRRGRRLFVGPRLEPACRQLVPLVGGGRPQQEHDHEQAGNRLDHLVVHNDHDDHNDGRKPRDERDDR